jgi:hypothetical protein
MFATCAICGIRYGTGRHFKDLTEGDILKAMRVGYYLSPYSMTQMLTSSLVLVALLHCLLPDNDCGKNLYRDLPLTNYRTSTPTSNNIHRHESQRPHWRFVPVRHDIPVHASIILLEQKSTRILCENRFRHCPYVLL